MPGAAHVFFTELETVGFAMCPWSGPVLKWIAAPEARTGSPNGDWPEGRREGHVAAPGFGCLHSGAWPGGFPLLVWHSQPSPVLQGHACCPRAWCGKKDDEAEVHLYHQSWSLSPVNVSKGNAATVLASAAQLCSENFVGLDL